MFSSVKASRIISGSNPDEGDEFTLSVGSGQTVDNGRINVENMNSPATVVEVYGEVYDE